MTRQTAIVTGGTPNLAGSAGVMFLSLRHFSPQLVDESDLYFVSIGEMAEADRRALERIGDTTIPMPPQVAEMVGPVPWRFTIGLLSRFETLRLAGTYRRCIWLDEDQLNTASILPAIDHVSQPFGLIPTPGLSVRDSVYSPTERPGESDAFAELDGFVRVDPAVDLDVPGVAGGVFVLTDLEEPERLHDGALDFLRRFKNILRWPDLAAIPLLIAKEGIQWEALDQRLLTYASEYPLSRLLSLPASEVPMFIHAAGKQKFWNGYEHDLYTIFYWS